MMVWHGHPKTMTFKLTRLPKGYPNGFKFLGRHEAEYMDYEDRYRLALLLHSHPSSTHTRCGLCSKVLCESW